MSSTGCENLPKWFWTYLKKKRGKSPPEYLQTELDTKGELSRNKIFGTGVHHFSETMITDRSEVDDKRLLYNNGFKNCDRELDAFYRGGNAPKRPVRMGYVSNRRKFNRTKCLMSRFATETV